MHVFPAEHVEKCCSNVAFHAQKMLQLSCCKLQAKFASLPVSQNSSFIATHFLVAYLRDKILYNVWVASAPSL